MDVSAERYMHELTSVAIEAMARLYPSCTATRPNIHTVIDAEESAFVSTLRPGTAIFEAAVEENKRKSSQHPSPALKRSSCTTPTASRST